MNNLTVEWPDEHKIHQVIKFIITNFTPNIIIRETLGKPIWKDSLKITLPALLKMVTVTKNKESL